MRNKSLMWGLGTYIISINLIGPRLLLFHQPHLSDLGNRNITVNQIPT